jgi:hypothetical protein
LAVLRQYWRQFLARLICYLRTRLLFAFALLPVQVAFNFAAPARGFAAASNDETPKAIVNTEGGTSAAAGAAAPDVLAGDAHAARDLMHKGGGEATSVEPKASSSSDKAGDGVDGQPKG